MPYNAASDAVVTAVTHASNDNVYALTFNRESACGTFYNQSVFTARSKVSEYCTKILVNDLA